MSLYSLKDPAFERLEDDAEVSQKSLAIPNNKLYQYWKEEATIEEGLRFRHKPYIYLYSPEEGELT